jgi:hypothetical protein
VELSNAQPISKPLIKSIVVNTADESARNEIRDEWAGDAMKIDIEHVQDDSD